MTFGERNLPQTPKYIRGEFMATFSEVASGGIIGNGFADWNEWSQRFLHPTISFKVNLFPPNATTTVGPKTNARTTDFIDLAGLPSAAEAHNQRTIQIPGVSGHLRHGDTFNLHGQLALRVKKTYSSGTLNDAFSTPLIVTNSENLTT